MAIIQELNLFSWKDFQDDVQNLGDLERLKLVIETLPDQKLIQTLSALRGNGRNDHPISAMWNSILAGIVFEHASIESLRRELSRNAQLREMCGFNPILGVGAVPSKSSYNRFLSNLVTHEPLIREMFDCLVKELTAYFPDFGTNLAGDGKAIHSFGKPSKKKDGDKRHEEEADWGVKKYTGVDQDGKVWEKVKSWFGFRLHLIVDADAELPVSYTVTKASVGEQPVMSELFVDLNRVHPELIERCEHAMFDKGYDSKEKICSLWNKYGIKPIIDIRNMWKDGEKTKQLKSKKIQNVTYDYKGTIFCHCPKTGEVRQMAYGGFEEKRETLKYICPALAYGIECKGASECPIYLKSIRIPLHEDSRIFTPVARSSYKWKALYDNRTSVERVNSRIDVSFGFERHYIRGLQKMKLRCGLALSVMLAIAVGRLRQKQPDLMRSFVKTA
jgi:transposase